MKENKPEPVRFWAAVAMLLLSVIGAHAELSAPVPISQLAQKGDLIVTGTIISGRQGNGFASLIVKIDRVVKGSVSAGGTVSLSWQSVETRALPDLDLSGISGVFFAQIGPTGSLTILSATVNPIDVRFTFFGLPPTAVTPVSYAPSDSITDKLIRELMPTQRYRRTTLSAAFDVISAAKDSAGSPAAIETALKLLTSSDTTDRLVGMQTLLIQGNVPALATLEADPSWVLGPAPGAVLSIPQTLGQFYRNPDPAGLAILGRICQTSKDVSLLDGALRALAMIHTNDALPYLVPFLDSQDPTLLQYAIGGLAMFANGVPIGYYHPTSSPYLSKDTIAHSCMGINCITKRPSYYRDFWKEWWADHHELIGK